MRTRLIVFFTILLASSCSSSGENPHTDAPPETTPNANSRPTAIAETSAEAENPAKVVSEEPSPTVPDIKTTFVDPDRDGWQVLVPKRKGSGNLKESYVPDGKGGKIKQVVRTYTGDTDVVFKLPANRTGLPQLDDLFLIGTVMEIGAEDSVYAYTLFIRGVGVDHDSDSTYEHSRSHSIPFQIVDKNGNGRFIRHYGGAIQIPDWVLRKKRLKEKK